MGYVRVDESINPGESIDVPFTWKAEPGVHVLKVAANDILDNLKEISVENNTKTVALTTQQVNSLMSWQMKLHGLVETM